MAVGAVQRSIVDDNNTLIVKLIKQLQQYLSGKGEGAIHLRALIAAFYLRKKSTVLTESQWSERACDGLEVHDSTVLRTVEKWNSR
jgi:hypothetical protein